MIKNSARPYIVSVTDVTALRAVNTDYTNTSGRTLIVYVSLQMAKVAPADTCGADGLIDGVIVSAIANFLAVAGNFVGMLMLTVPPGAVYRVNANACGGASTTMLSWVEAY